MRTARLLFPQEVVPEPSQENEEDVSLSYMGLMAN